MFDLNVTQFFSKNLESIFINLISNGLYSILFVIPIGIYLYKKFENKENKVEFQTYISGESSHIICQKDNYLVEDIPKILLEYRKKLSTKDKKEELYFWNTRISTFIVFTDGVRILLYDRKDNKEKELFNNPKWDVYGAVKFHNGSLKYKLPSSFMNTKILSFESIPGVAIENNIDMFLFVAKHSEIAIMMGFIAYVSAEDLENGIKEDLENNVESNDNKLVPISCLSPDDENLTAKAKLGIKYLQSKVVAENDDFISCKKEEFQNEGIEPSLYTNEEVIKDNLKEINGIGTKIEESLNEIGIFTFKQITEWSEDNIAWIDNQLPFKRRVVKKEWIKEAERLFNSQNKETHA